MRVLDLAPGQRHDIPGPLDTVRCRRFLTFYADGQEVGYVNAELDFTQLAPSLYEAALEALQPRSVEVPRSAPEDDTPRRAADDGKSAPTRMWWRRLFGTP